MANMDVLSTSGNTSVGGTLSVTGTSGFTGAVTTTGALTVGTNLSVTGIGKILYVRKGSDESVTSSSTVQDDDELVLAVATNSEYFVYVQCYLSSASSTPGFKIGFTVPASASLVWGEDRARNGATSAAGPITQAIGAGTSLCTGYTGSLTTAGTSGNLQLQWAQSTSNGTATTLKAGSFMILIRVA